MRVLLMPLLLCVSTACGEHKVDPSTIAIPESGVFTSESGLIKQVLSCPEGSALVPESQTCASDATPLSNPSAVSQVTVHYTGWTTDGVEFDSSVRRGKPISFGLNQVIKGWTEGVQTMVENEQARLWIPEDLAYEGKSGPPAGMLVFDIELLAFTAPAAPITVELNTEPPAEDPADSTESAGSDNSSSEEPEAGESQDAEAGAQIENVEPSIDSPEE
jgi:hypothetical protein